ncbi:putative motility protein [Iodobacter ciconiae]|uniref:Putative motility protein n=1 Tax=Iodobacter ciconiae TaxID=2496266 RepID=A0A3S8ZRT9_9NEIS|nr:YjfB family protein [Iodobacter ciconiae]AZN36174.1 putative motility protein [Iodobacter ciconiae]
MDVLAINATGGAGVQSAAALLMAKKSMDMQAKSALSLLEAVPAPKYNNPAGLGSVVDTRA